MRNSDNFLIDLAILLIFGVLFDKFKPRAEDRFNNGETLICNRYIFSPASKNINKDEWVYDEKKKVFYNKITKNYFGLNDCNEFK